MSKKWKNLVYYYLLIICIIFFNCINIRYNMYVISKLNVIDNSSELIKSLDTEEECIKLICDMIDNKMNIYRLGKKNNNKRIEEYELTKGYIYNSKKMIYIYEILLIPE